MRLLAISDLHVTHPGQRDALARIPPHPEDWLIVAGDVCERLDDLAATWQVLNARFAKLIWVPGNHELYAVGRDSPRGVAKYDALVQVCRDHGVHTPEDGWIRWPGQGPPRAIVPMFLLYDYSFGPEGMSPDEVVAWAADGGIRCTDEVLLHPDPYPTLEAWCAARVAATTALLDTVPADHTLVLINHWPLRRDLVRLFRIPRFVPWCGTRRTASWHTRYPAEVCVSGHLHMRATDWRDGVRFEEVAIGYPRHWNHDKGMAAYLREILPGSAPPPPSGNGGPTWHR